MCVLLWLSLKYEIGMVIKSAVVVCQMYGCVGALVVGDATMATFPANGSPAYATNAAISFAALRQLITQCSWVTAAGEGAGEGIGTANLARL